MTAKSLFLSLITAIIITTVTATGSQQEDTVPDLSAFAMQIQNIQHDLDGLMALFMDMEVAEKRRLTEAALVEIDVAEDGSQTAESLSGVRRFADYTNEQLDALVAAYQAKQDAIGGILDDRRRMQNALPTPLVIHDEVLVFIHRSNYGIIRFKMTVQLKQNNTFYLSCDVINQKLCGVYQHNENWNSETMSGDETRVLQIAADFTFEYVEVRGGELGLIVSFPDGHRVQMTDQIHWHSKKGFSQTLLAQYPNCGLYPAGNPWKMAQCPRSTLDCDKWIWDNDDDHHEVQLSHDNTLDSDKPTRSNYWSGWTKSVGTDMHVMICKKNLK